MVLELLYAMDVTFWKAFGALLCHVNSIGDRWNVRKVCDHSKIMKIAASSPLQSWAI